MRYSMVVVAAVATVCLASPALAAFKVDRCKAARLTGVQELITEFCKGSAGEDATPQNSGDDASPQGSGNDGAMDASPAPTAPDESQSTNAGGSDSSQAGGQFDPNATPPKGSWALNCRKSNAFGWHLTAECKGNDGTWNETSLMYKGCPDHAVASVNGNLICEQDAPPESTGQAAPGGSMGQMGGAGMGPMGSGGMGPTGNGSSTDGSTGQGSGIGQ